MKKKLQPTFETKPVNNDFRDFFKNMKVKTPKVCLEAVKKDGMLLEFVDEENQTEESCLEAIRQNPKSFKLVINETENISMEVIKSF